MKLFQWYKPTELTHKDNLVFIFILYEYKNGYKTIEISIIDNATSYNFLNKSWFIGQLKIGLFTECEPQFYKINNNDRHVIISKLLENL